MLRILRPAALAAVLLACARPGLTQSQLPQEVQRGRDWLIDQIDSDGGIDSACMRLATEPQTRAEVIDSLQHLAATPANLVQQQMAAPNGAGSEHLARKVIALARAQQSFDPPLTELRSRQNADGGFGGGSNHASTVLDTSFALIALRVAGVPDGPDIARAVNYLVARGDHGDNDWAMDAHARPYVAAYLLLALQMHSPHYAIGATVAAQREALIAQQGNGVYAETLLDTVAAIALRYASTSDGGLIELKTAILGAQSLDGSWQGDCFLTALALRVLASEAVLTPADHGALVLRVRDAVTLNPLPGVHLTVAQRPDLDQLFAAVDGRIQVDDLAGGNYDLSLAKPGYASRSLTGVSVVAGRTRDLGSVDLGRDASAAVVFGRVTDVATTAPLAGVVIRVSGAATADTLTAPDGSYELLFATAGEVEVRATHPGYQSVVATGSLVLGRSLRFAPALYSDGGQIPDTAAFSATVVHALTDTPLPGATVVLGAATNTSDANGVLRLTGLAPGSFHATISMAGFLSTELEGTLVAGVNDAGLIRLSPASSSASSSLSGRVTDASNGAAIPGARIGVSASNLHAMTDANGQYSIGDITNVPFVATTTAPGYTTQHVSAGAEAHGNFHADFALERQASADVAMDGLVMSAPEYAPFNEVGVLGTVRNLSATTEVDLIFSALISNAAGEVIRDVPHVQITFNRSFADTIIHFAPSESKPITISWGNFNDPAGDYSVLFRGATVDGRVVVEGATSYRIRSTITLGGGIIANPPLVQAGTGQAVALSADLTNMGNNIIPSGDVKLSIKLVAQDDRPPLPAKPTFAANLISGAPLSSAHGITRDAAGNVYTLNTSPTADLIKVTPGGVGSVVRALPLTSSTSVALGTPLSVSWRAPNLLRLAWSSGWIADLDLDNANSIDNFTAPPDGVSVVTAYAFDAARGNEYFGAEYQLRRRVLLRNASGVTSVLVDAGLTQGAESQFGPDGKLYVTANVSQGAVFRIDPETRAIDPYWIGLSYPRALAIDATGVVYVTGNYWGCILRRFQDGRVETYASFSSLNFSDLKFGRDGLLYGLADDGSLRRFDANGANAVFARGIINSVAGVAVDDSSGIYAHDGRIIRYRHPLTGTITLGNAVQDVTDLIADGESGPLIATGTALMRVVGASYQNLLTVPNHAIRRLAAMGTDVLIGASDGARAVLARSDRNSFEPIAASPFSATVSDIKVAADGSLIIVNSDSVVAIASDGTQRLVARIAAAGPSALDRVANQLWLSNGEGLLRIDLASGVKTRLRAALPNMSFDFSVDPTGAPVYGDYSARKLLRYDPVADTVSDYHVFAPGLTPYEVALTPDGVVFTRFSDASVRRLDGAIWTEVASNVYELLAAADGALGHRIGDKLYAAPLTGTAATLLSTMLVAPAQAAWISADRFASYNSARTQLKMLSASGQLLRSVIGFQDLLAVAATADGDIYALDWQRNVVKVSNGVLTFVGQFANAVDMSSRNNDILLTTSGGLYRLLPDHTIAIEQTVPGWETSVGQYGGHASNAQSLLMFNVANGEIVRVSNGAVVERFAPFFGATSLASRVDGSWLIGSTARVIALDADAQHSRLYSTSAGAFDLLVRADGSVITAPGDDKLKALDANGLGSAYSGVLSEPGVNIRSIAEDPSNGSVYAVTNAGVIYRVEYGWLQPFVAGVTEVNAILPRANGEILLSSEQTGAILQHAAGQTVGIARVIDQPRAMCMLDDDTLAVAGNEQLSIVNIGGSMNFTSMQTVTDVRTVACDSNGELLLVSRAQNRIVRAQAGAQQAALQPGAIVREQIVAMPELTQQNNLQLGFDSWIPPQGGDYELSIVPLDSTVSGGLLSGYHVGSAAEISMSATPHTAVPGDQVVQVDTRVSGVDFTRLARINPAQLQLASSTVVPESMSLDPDGQLWFTAARNLWRMHFGDVNATQVSNYDVAVFHGELPIDSQGRVYYVTTPDAVPAYELRRIAATGASVRITDFGNVAVASMTIDTQDRIFVLTSDNNVHLVMPDGARSMYATMPAGSAPYGITRDGMGNLYVQQKNPDRIYYVSATRDIVELDLRGASFEEEGVNIAGDCGQGVFLTPLGMPGTGQGGEEHTIVHVVGRTGEIGTVLNGRVISDDLVDIDFITYDRFGSRLLLVSESVGTKLFTVPVTCGAISTTLHLVVAAGQPVLGTQPGADSTLVRANGDVEYTWNLEDVNRQGVTTALTTILPDLQRGETRPVLKEAFALLHNSFQPAPVRIEVDIAQVQVRDLFQIGVIVAADEYPQQTPIDISVPVENPDTQSREGRLLIEVVDAGGAVVTTLVDRRQVLAAGEAIMLTPPYNSGTLGAGDYQVMATLRDEQNEIVAQASDSFRIVIGSGSGAVLAATVVTDKPLYLTGESARLIANVQNLSANLALTDLHIDERIVAANGTVVFDGSLPLANLEPGAQARVEFVASLTDASSGVYDVYQQIRSASGALLDSQAIQFSVQSTGGVSALTGSLTIEAAHVRRGTPLAVAAVLLNRGDTSMLAVESILRLIVPQTGATLSEWRTSHDVAAGANSNTSASFDTSALPPRDYLALLIVRVAGVERVLAQKPFWVEDAVFTGTISAAPNDVTRGATVTLRSNLQNVGNAVAIGTEVVVAVHNATTGARLREWRQATALPAAATQVLEEALDTSALPMGDYQARLSVYRNDQEQPLAVDTFTVREAVIAGTFQADPEQVAHGGSIELRGTVMNSGNLGVAALPLRIEVVRVDSTVTVLSLDDSAALPPQTQNLMLRIADTSGFVYGEYDGVFSAFFDGRWQVLSSDRFEVLRPVGIFKDSFEEPSRRDVEISIDVPRDARVLMLLSCSEQQAGGAGNAAQTVCEQQRQLLMSQYLAERGIEHQVVLDAASFMRALRCGRYNVFWFSGGALKLGVAETREVRESIYRGDGFIIEGDNDQRNNLFDDMLGVDFRGHHAQTDLAVTGMGSLFPAVSVPAYGRMLEFALSTGTVLARFESANAPAIVSASYGQGRTLTYAFDLVEVLRRDGAQPARERLLTNALVHVAPWAESAAFAISSYVPVTTTVLNRGSGFAARIIGEVVAPTAIVSSSPLANVGNQQHSVWDFTLGEGQQRSFDANVLTAGTSSNQVRSQIFERSGGALLSLGNVQVDLSTMDATHVTAMLLNSLRTVQLSDSEAEARQRAILAIEDARAAEAAGNTSLAITRWLEAADEMRHISSVSPAPWRLAIAQLLAVTQHMGCAALSHFCPIANGTPQCNVGAP